jgi:hypothetical protein
MSRRLTFTPSPAVDRRKVEAIVSALRRRGPLGPRELSRQVQARLWGPGRFRTALARAQREGLVRRSGGGRTSRPEPPAAGT